MAGETEAGGSEESMSDLPHLNVTVDLPAVGLSQVKVTLSEEMRIVDANDLFQALLGPRRIYSNFTSLLESDPRKLFWFLRSIAFDVTTGHVFLPHVARFGPVVLCSATSTLKYRTTLVVTLGTSWAPENPAVTITLYPAVAHVYNLNDTDETAGNPLGENYCTTSSLLQSWLMQSQASQRDAGKGMPSGPVQISASQREQGKNARSADTRADLDDFAEKLAGWPRARRAACTKVSL